jgi:hypothetical protein
VAGELGGKHRQPFSPAVCGSVFHPHVAAVDKSSLLHAASKRSDQTFVLRKRNRREISNQWSLLSANARRYGRSNPSQ